jgi:hypothetical protein
VFPHPDFELYDNPGRTIEQINTAKTGMPTRDYRRRSSVKNPVPKPVGPAITTWTERLHTAEPGEVAQLVVLAVSYPDGALPRLHEFLETAADRLHQAGADEAVAELTGILGRLRELDQDLYDTAVDAFDTIDAAQRRTTAATRTSPTASAHPVSPLPAAVNHPPTTPPASPAPDNPHAR